MWRHSHFFTEKALSKLNLLNKIFKHKRRKTSNFDFLSHEKFCRLGCKLTPKWKTKLYLQKLLRNRQHNVFLCVNGLVRKLCNTCKNVAQAFSCRISESVYPFWKNLGQFLDFTFRLDFRSFELFELGLALRLVIFSFGGLGLGLIA